MYIKDMFNDNVRVCTNCVRIGASWWVMVLKNRSYVFGGLGRCCEL